MKDSYDLVYAAPRLGQISRPILPERFAAKFWRALFRGGDDADADVEVEVRRLAGSALAARARWRRPSWKRSEPHLRLARQLRLAASQTFRDLSSASVREAALSLVSTVRGGAFGFIANVSGPGLKRRNRRRCGGLAGTSVWGIPIYGILPNQVRGLSRWPGRDRQEFTAIWRAFARKDANVS